MASHKKHATGRVVGLRVLLAVLVVVVLGGAAYLIRQQLEIKAAEDRMSANGTPAVSVGAPASDTSAATTAAELPDNPIDFSKLWETNVESYAWMYIPNTDINAPVQQSASDDLFYLTHDAAGNESAVGSAFSQLANKRDFSDPVTVIYGHDVGGVFKNLHYFEDAQFFNDNPNFYIYTPGHILTYTIVSAYKYDDRHILNSFDFSKESVRQDYFDFVRNPNSLVKNVRDDVELNTDSKIVQFSTCMLNEFHGSSRYIVTGVLTSDQETK